MGAKRKPRKIEAHPTKWQVVIDRGERTGMRLHETKAEADNVAAALNLAADKVAAFVTAAQILFYRALVRDGR
jgi:hypothetical protein